MADETGRDPLCGMTVAVRGCGQVLLRRVDLSLVLKLCKEDFGANPVKFLLKK